MSANSTELNSLICFAHVHKPFALLGEIKCSFVLDLIAPIPDLSVVIWKKANQTQVLQVKSLRQVQQYHYFKFEHFPTPEVAKTLTGGQLLLPKNECKQYFYYIFSDFSDFTVLNTKGEKIGTVLQVEESPAHPLIHIQLINQQTLLVPFVEAFILHTNENQKTITAHLEPLLDI